MMAKSFGRAQRVVEPWRVRVGSVRTWVEQTILWRIWERMLENEFVDRSVALASKAFVSLFPLVIVVAAFAPARTRTSILDSIRVRFGLSGPALNSVKGAFASASDIRRATGVLGLVLTVFYATSFTTALQRVYLKAWRRPPGGKVGGYVRGPAWMGSILAFLAILGGARRILTGGPGTAVYALIAFFGSVLLWWVTAWLLLEGQVRWRVLLFSGAVTGTAMTIFAGSASLWMPDIVTKDQTQFGFFGVALALVTWFSFASTIVMVGVCAGAVVAEDPGNLGRWVRGADPSFLNPGARASLPAPTRTLHLADAIGIEDDEEEDEPSPTKSG
jgi:membrane protein